ncbi:MAG: family 10 glycosylhydrolase, partial [Bacilli bacterium]|nr:family 10 glycosylhydrolase [Bacilli bacterium]
IAWINPYRVRTTSNIESINSNELIYKYINTDYLYINNGIYLNPSKREVEDLIINGVKEVLNYKIDGVLFDDYFYPSDDIDTKDYENYLKENEYVSKEEYQLNIINKMIKRVHSECNKKDVLFGVSPDGNIENNYNYHRADVRLWMKDNDYIDYIMPQIYYGFYNSTKAYVNVIREWESLLNNNIDLYIALAFYKVGLEDKYAKEGRDEWILNDNIIMREVLLSRNLKNYRGFSLFRYDNVFESDYFTSNSLKELNNLKKIIK